MLLATLFLSTRCSAFTRTQSSPQVGFMKNWRYRQDNTGLCAKGRDEDQGGNFKHWFLRSDIKQFLTQRSIQSFVYLLSECRDIQTVNWMEEFVGSKGLLHYHGTGKFNMTRYPEWDSIFLKMIDEPASSVKASVKQKGSSSRGVWNPLTGKRNKVNPYLNKDEKIVETDIEVDPASLVARIMTVREHIAREWLEDLNLLLKVNTMIIDSYEDAMLDEEDDNNSFSLPDIYSEFSSSVQEQQNEDLSALEKKSYDSLQKYMVSSYPGFDAMLSSPLRKSNFDLLFLLATQESVHRVLKSYKEDGESKDIYFQWLRDFYRKNVEAYFDGPQELGSSDEFLEDILTTQPSIQTDKLKQIVGIVDTFVVAEDIVKARSKVAKEWRMLSMDIPEEHESLKKMIFKAKMEKWGQSMMDAKSKTSQVVEEGVMIEEGEFE